MRAHQREAERERQRQDDTPHLGSDGSLLCKKKKNETHNNDRVNRRRSGDYGTYRHVRARALTDSAIFLAGSLN